MTTPEGLGWQSADFFWLGGRFRMVRSATSPLAPAAYTLIALSEEADRLLQVDSLQNHLWAEGLAALDHQAAHPA